MRNDQLTYIFNVPLPADTACEVRSVRGKSGRYYSDLLVCMVAY